MDLISSATTENKIKASLIHKDGHWTDPPPPHLLTLKLLHKSLLLGRYYCYYNYINLLISLPISTYYNSLTPNLQLI